MKFAKSIMTYAISAFLVLYSCNKTTNYDDAHRDESGVVLPLHINQSVGNDTILNSIIQGDKNGITGTKHHMYIRTFNSKDSSVNWQTTPIELTYKGDVNKINIVDVEKNGFSLDSLVVEQ